MTSSLTTDPIQSLLDRLHQQAKGDKQKFLKLIPSFLTGRMKGKSLIEIMTPELMKDVFIPISREQGEFLYLTARSLGARRIVEFGTSFGISTIYLGAAIKDNGGGWVIGSEIEPSKHAKAVDHLRQAGLADITDVRLGDALQTLADLEVPVDLVLLDGWKDLYMPVLKLLTPKLRHGSVVMADNIFTFRKDLRPYVEYMQSGDNGFISTTLHIADGFEYSVYTG
jgi:predicted O-methyltransferase YrrM